MEVALTLLKLVECTAFFLTNRLQPLRWKPIKAIQAASYDAMTSADAWYACRTSFVCSN